jgi:hypothetical protein
MKPVLLLIHYGFSPLALSMYNSSYDENMITAEEAPYYLLTAAKTVQIEGVIMKLSDDGDFVTTLTGSNIDETNYESLAEGDFDDMIMNRFPRDVDGINVTLFPNGFFAYNIANPADYDDNTPPTGAGDIFWGEKTNYDDNLNGLIEVHEDYYIFWIRVKKGPSTYVPIIP